MIKVVYIAWTPSFPDNKLRSDPRFFVELDKRTSEVIETNRNAIQSQLGKHYRVIAMIETDQLIKEKE